jgi:hypothetical protein
MGQPCEFQVVGNAKKNELANNKKMDRSNVGRAAAALPEGIEIPELTPRRHDVGDTEGIRSHLAQHGFVAIKDVASAAELEHARSLLWSHLGEHGWVEGEPRTYTDAAWAAGSNRQGVQGAHLNPLGLSAFLNPLGLFLRTFMPFVWRFLSAFLPA